LGSAHDPNNLPPFTLRGVAWRYGSILGPYGVPASFKLVKTSLLKFSLLATVLAVGWALSGLMRDRPAGGVRVGFNNGTFKAKSL
jgi:hypothetical protein